MVGILNLMSIKEASALDGNIRYIQSKNNAKSYVETRVFYDLPWNMKGYTFIDFYKNGNGYFGKTFWNKTIKYSVGLEEQIIHNNEPFTETGFGVNAFIPYIPKKAFAKVSVVPLWFDKNGKLEDKVTVGYVGSIDLPKGYKLSSFGEWDIGAKGGPKWTYGEIDLGKKIGPVYVSYNPALISNGDATPRVEHRISVSVDF